jgi:exopolysaccharide biosynthesis protein
MANSITRERNEEEFIKPRRKKTSIITKFFRFIIFLIILLALAGAFLMYGPISYFRDIWISTAMSTAGHQWLAENFFDKKTIAAVMALNTVNAPNENSNPNLIKVPSISKNVDLIPKDNSTTLPTRPSEGEHIIDGIGFIKLRNNSIKGDSYNGWLIKVYDPSRLSMGLAQDYGQMGEHISHMARRLDKYVGVNAGAFLDPGGHGNGSLPSGVFIYNGKILSGVENSTTTYPIIGFDYENRMILGNFNKQQIKADNLKYGIQFSPFLIVNGKLSDVRGYSIQPRTAIGQTANGTILLLIIDGRTVSSPGATMQNVQNVMVKYGAVNAANTDGGSSTTFVFNGKVINHPCGPAGERYFPNAFLINR